MEYKRNSIYNYIVTKMQAKFSNLYCTSKQTIKPKSFPAMSLAQFNLERTQAGQTLNDTDGIYMRDLELAVISNKEGSMQSEAFAISEYAETLLRELHFRLISQNTVDNTTTYSVVSHFRRNVGDDEQLPTL